MYCGVSVVVRQAIAAATGSNVSNLLQLADQAAKAGNNKEAFDYYTRVLEVDSDNAEAWFGKGEAAGCLSTLQEFRLAEMISGIERALQLIPEAKKTEMNARAATAPLCANVDETSALD
jgi:Flp pilus assembly protein TadD